MKYVPVHDQKIVGLFHFGEKLIKDISMQRKYLPIIKFGEIHHDPLTNRILKKLIPYLEKLGYEFYFDEVEPSFTITDSIQEAQQNVAAFCLYERYFHVMGLDITLQDDFDKGLKVLQETNPSISDSFIFVLKSVITKYKAERAKIEFLKTLRDSGIKFLGVDCERRRNLKTGEDFQNELLRLYEMMNVRDKLMANACMQTNVPVFGRVGIAHIIGIQNAILKEFSHKEASARFCFFYLHSLTPESKSVRGKVFEEIQKDVTASLQSSLLGITSIDMTEMRDEDEIVTTILNQIAKKSEELKNLEEERVSLNEKAVQLQSFSVKESSKMGLLQFPIRMEKKFIESLAHGELENLSCEHSCNVKVRQ